MKIDGSVAFVTGANRGLGEQFVRALFEAGAAKVYAGARDPAKVTVSGAVPVAVDITDHESVRAASAQAQDVTLLINNAGSTTRANILTSDLDAFRTEFETHVLGTLAMSRAFAPVLERNGGGALVNVLSVLSWVSIPVSAGYAAAKSAEWSVTNALRVALAEQGTQVTALHVSYLATGMAANVRGPKADPGEVARAALIGVEAGRHEVLADEVSKQVQAALPGDRTNCIHNCTVGHRWSDAPEGTALPCRRLVDTVRSSEALMSGSEPNPHQDLVDQTVVVIGASSGIGLETARQVRAAGGQVVMVARDPQRLERAAAEVRPRSTATLDAADTDRLQQFFSDLPYAVDHVISTAGGPLYAPLADMDVAETSRHFGERLAMTLGIAKYSQGRVRDAGTLLFIGGTGGRRPGIGRAVTSALTAALPALTANLALELAPIRVNLIAAGFVDTPLSASLLGNQVDTRREELRASLPIRRVVGPEDVAALAVHIMCNEALTGATYDIDGGQQLLSQ